MGFGKDGKGTIGYDRVNAGAIGALAALDVLSLGGAYSGTLVEDLRMIKLDYSITIRPAAAISVLDGPVIVGIADAVLDGAAIEEAIESTILNPNSTDIELSMRPVWPLETFILIDPDAGGSSVLTKSGSKNIRWTFNNPNGWRWWIYNKSGAALVTGSFAEIFAKFFGVWVS